MPEPRRDGLQGWLSPGSRMTDISEAFVVVKHYSYEGDHVISVWLTEEGARATAAVLNGTEHLDCGDDPHDCFCPHKVRRVPLET